MTDREKYELSLFQTISVIRENDHCKIELTENTLDGQKYIKKTYYSDKRDVMNAVAGIRSPYLPEIIGVYFGSETIVIETYVEGALLSDLLEKGSRIDGNRIADGLIEAVALLHAGKIIHRDIKPSNIMIRPEGEAVLIDFGIARLFDENKECDTEHFGTVGYAPPEQFGYQQSDFRSDIYALGKTLGKMAEAGAVSGIYQRVSARASAFDPQARFQTVDEIKRAILRMRRRRGILLLCAASMMILLCGVLCFALVNHGRTGRQEAVEEREDEQISDIETEKVSMGASGAEDSRLMELSMYHGEIEVYPVSKEKTETELALNGKTVRMAYELSADTLLLSLDDADYSFELEKEDNPEYQDTETMAELILYDLDGDGETEILPVLGDGKYVEEQEMMLLNGVTGWCLVPNGGEYCQAKGTFCRNNEKPEICDAMPKAIIGDYPERFCLIDGEIVAEK